MDQQGQQIQTQQPRRTTPARHSSSSPSNGDPTEPTVDLSAWSPRSRCLPATQLLPLTTATENPIESQNPPRTHLGTRVHLLSVSLPSPIALNSLSLLRTTAHVSRALDTAQKTHALPTTIPFNLSYRSERSSKGADLANLYLPLTLFQEGLGTPLYLFPNIHFQIGKSPTHCSPFILLTMSSALTPLSPKARSNGPLSLLSKWQQNSSKFSAHSSPPRAEISRTLWIADQSTQNSSDPDQAPTIEQEPIKNNLLIPDGPTKGGENSTITLAQPEDMGPIYTAPLQLGKKKGGRKHQPTRRSQRLQAKQQAPMPTPKKSDKAKSKTVQLPFDRDSHDTPIDVSATLAILQATGLTITKQIEQLVEQEAGKTKIDSTNEESAPSTPLHDHIPPLLLPGLDLVL